MPRQPAVVPGTIGHMIPTPGIGQPDGRKGIQVQVTPIGEEAAGFHDNWLLTLCALISILVLGAAAVGHLPLPPRRQPDALAQFAQHDDRGDLDPGPGPDPGRDRDSLDPAAAPPISPPPADLTVKVTGHQWYWSYEYPDNGVSFDSYMLKEANDPTRQANQRARTDADGPPLLAADERMVIPAGKVVKFIVTADDVIHSFAVPAFWIKQDANPGQLHETWAKVDRPGVYFGQCSELCGARHGFMPIAVEVVPPAQFAPGSHRRAGTWPALRHRRRQHRDLAGSAVRCSAAAAPTAPAPPTAAAPRSSQPATAQN